MQPASPSKGQSLNGIWKSRYRFTSSSRDGEFEGHHQLRLTRKGRFLILESLPGQISYLIMRLSLEDNIATGSWQEETNPHGYYQGAIYHGAVQFVLDPDQKHMRGKWLGFDKDMEVSVGPWELTYLGENPPEDIK